MVILFSILSLYIGKVVLEATGHHISENFSWFSFTCFAGIYAFLLIWNLKKVLSSYHDHNLITLTKNVNSKIKTASVNFKTSTLIFWAWLWRFILAMTAIFTMQFQLGLYQFAVTSVMRTPAQGKNVPLEIFHFDLFPLKAMPGNLIILLASVYFLKIALEKYYNDYSIVLVKKP